MSSSRTLTTEDKTHIQMVAEVMYESAFATQRRKKFLRDAAALASGKLCLMTGDDMISYFEGQSNPKEVEYSHAHWEDQARFFYRLGVSLILGHLLPDLRQNPAECNFNIHTPYYSHFRLHGQIPRQSGIVNTIIDPVLGVNLEPELQESPLFTEWLSGQIEVPQLTDLSASQLTIYAQQGFLVSLPSEDGKPPIWKYAATPPTVDNTLPPPPAPVVNLSYGSSAVFENDTTLIDLMIGPSSIGIAENSDPYGIDCFQANQDNDRAQFGTLPHSDISYTRRSLAVPPYKQLVPDFDDVKRLNNPLLVVTAGDESRSNSIPFQVDQSSNIVHFGTPPDSNFLSTYRSLPVSPYNQLRPPVENHTSLNAPRLNVTAAEDRPCASDPFQVNQYLNSSHFHTPLNPNLTDTDQSLAFTPFTQPMSAPGYSQHQDAGPTAGFPIEGGPHHDQSWVGQPPMIGYDSVIFPNSQPRFWSGHLQHPGFEVLPNEGGSNYNQPSALPGQPPMGRNGPAMTKHSLSMWDGFAHSQTEYFPPQQTTMADVTQPVGAQVNSAQSMISRTLPGQAPGVQSRPYSHQVPGAIRVPLYSPGQGHHGNDSQFQGRLLAQLDRSWQDGDLQSGLGHLQGTAEAPPRPPPSYEASQSDFEYWLWNG
ncbi:hypothetical protein M231_04566 [Tremella mesenterica]|uniref:Uncharacterized protein n=1 Tax=Tremella mesenterica TaxID=5217 RepID=A0A4Q1BKR2_TREME|nr:hypothetical protein M231_04566 [Tremella mesenterica]